MATTQSLGFRIFSTFDNAGTRQAAQELMNLNNVMRDIGKIGRAGFLTAATAIAAFGVKAITAGVAYNALEQTARGALETVLDGTTAANAQMDKLVEFGSTSPFSRTIWIEAQQQLLAFGLEAEKVVPTLSAIQDAMVAAGQGEQGIREVVRVFAQLESTGKVTAGTLNQLAIRGIDAATLVGNAWGKTAQQMREEVSRGTIDAGEFMDTLVSQMDDRFGGAAERMRATWVGALDRIKGATRDLGSVLVTPFIDPTGGGLAVDAANAFADMIRGIEAGLRPLAPLVRESLEPAFAAASDAMQRFGEAARQFDFSGVFMSLRDNLPAVATGMALFANSLKLTVPLLGITLGGLNPIAVAISTLAVTSPELRSALMDLVLAFTPLLPLVTQVAEVMAVGLTTAVKLVAIPIQFVADAVSWATNNFGDFLKVVTSVGVLIGAMSLVPIVAGFGAVATSAGIAATATGLFTRALGALRVAMLAHPFTAVLVGLAALGTAMMAVDRMTGDAIRSQLEFSGTMNNTLPVFFETGRAIGELDVDFENLNNGIRTQRGEVEAATWSWDAFGDGAKGATKAAELTDEEIVSLNENLSTLDREMAAAVDSGMDASDVLDSVADAANLSDGAVMDLVQGLPLYAEAARRANEATEEAIAAQQAYADAVGQSIVNLQGLSDAMNESFNPMKNLREAEENLTQAQLNYNAAVDEFGEGSQEAIDATWALGEATIDYTNATEVAGEVLHSGLTPAMMEAMRAAGVSEEAISELDQAMRETGQGGQDFADTLDSSFQDISTAAARMDTANRLSTQGMDQDWAEFVVNAKNNIDQMMDAGMSYDDALNEVSRSSQVSTGAIAGGFDDARAAGLQFSDKYPAEMTLSGVDVVIRGAEAAQRAIDRVNKHVPIVFEFSSRGQIPHVPTGGFSVASATGGLIRGPGGPMDDAIPARLSDGEFVIRAAAVDRYGSELFDSLNRMAFPSMTPGFANGGSVGSSTFSRRAQGFQPTQVNNITSVTVRDSVIGNRRDIEDLVVQGVEDARRHGRL